MAQQCSMLTFTGRLGKLTGFKRNNKYYFRKRPDGIHHTPNMQRAARRFGRASRMGALIRKAFCIAGDGGYINRFTKALIPSGGTDVKKLVGLQFNKARRTYAHFSKLPQLRDNGVLHIPAQTFPKGLKHIKITMIAVRVNLQTREVLGRDTCTLSIDTSQQFDGADLSVCVPGTGTLLIALSVNNSAEVIAVKETQVVCEWGLTNVDIPDHITAAPLLVLLE